MHIPGLILHPELSSQPTTSRTSIAVVTLVPNAPMNVWKRGDISSCALAFCESTSSRHVIWKDAPLKMIFILIAQNKLIIEASKLRRKIVAGVTHNTKKCMIWDIR